MPATLEPPLDAKATAKRGADVAPELDRDPAKSSTLPRASVRTPGSFPDAEFDNVPNVPIFAEHKTRSQPSEEHPEGRELNFGKDELKAVCDRCNRRIEETGDYAAIVLGHTPTPEQVAAGNAKQPELVGFAGPFRLGLIGSHDRPRWAILADFHTFKADAEKVRKNPRRSPELWLEDSYEQMFLDPISLLGAEAPRLDMGLLYSARKQGRQVERYSAVAPAATSVFVPAHGPSAPERKPTTTRPKAYSATAKPPKQESTIMLDQDEVKQIADAISQLDWAVWCKEQMQKSVRPADAADGSAEQKPVVGDDDEKPEQYAAGDDDDTDEPDGDEADDTLDDTLDDTEDTEDTEDAEDADEPDGDESDDDDEDQPKKYAAGKTIKIGPKVTRKKFSKAAAGDGGKSLTVDQRLAALEALNADLNEQLSHERGLRLNTERYSKLQSLRTKYVFDLDKSAEKVHYKKMNKQGFDGFVNFIQENCQAIHADTLLPVPADGGKDAPAPGRGDRRERYAKECRTRAFAIAEARALRGQEANYEGILESLLDGTYKEPI